MTTITSSLWDLARRLIVALALASAVILAPAFGILANVGTATVSAQSVAVSGQVDPGSINGGNNDPHRFNRYSPELAVPHVDISVHQSR